MNAETAAEAEAVAPKRQGRPPRAEKTQTERRRRKGGTVDKLAIPEHVKEAHPDMEFRWGRDDGGRMQALTQNDDWDKVPDVDPIHGGRGEAGGAMKLHLLMKPKAFMDEDRAEKLARNKAMLDAEVAKHPDAKTAETTGSETYQVPGNKI